jgi:glyoxylase-like metal-dependent hydrolase (beta-lactamase superfamily II)
VYYCLVAGVVIVGDALFAGSIGRHDFPGSSQRRLLRNIRENLLTLPPETVVYSGHGPTTTVAREKRYNPFVGLGAADEVDDED